MTSIYSYMMEDRRPELVRKIVAMDVGGVVKPGVLEGLMFVCYQMWLLLAFNLGKPVGDAMARTFARKIGAPSAARIATASSCYPYYHTWKDLVRGKKPKAMMPKCPLLFLYGRTGLKKYLVRTTFECRGLALSRRRSAALWPLQYRRPMILLLLRRIYILYALHLVSRRFAF